MADLAEMREFARHVDLYEEDRGLLASLARRPPVDLTDLTDDQRAACPLERPASARDDEAALARALVEAGVDNPPDGGDGESALWGWWLDDPAWTGLAGLPAALEALERARTDLAARVDEEDAACASSIRLAGFRDAIEGYRRGNEEDRERLVELEAQRDDPSRAYADAVAAARADGGLVPGRALIACLTLACALACLLIPVDVAARAVAVLAVAALGAVAWALPGRVPWRLWRKRAWMRAERERAAALAADCERRIAERDGEVEGLEQKAATYEEGLRAPFAGVRMRAEERVEGAEDAVLEILAGHLASNGVEVEGTGEGEPYDAALERAYRDEWDLLDSWMDGYRAGLASKLTHASRSLESELVWLEGHAPFGRRHWALAHEVADVMEREGCDASAALERVLEGDAGRDGDGSDAM